MSETLEIIQSLGLFCTSIALVLHLWDHLCRLRRIQKQIDNKKDNKDNFAPLV